MRNWLDITSEEKKQELLNLLATFNCKEDIYRYFNVCSNTANHYYLNEIAQEIGFDFKIYKDKKKKFCLQCNKELVKDQKKFCSKSCAAKFNNKNRKLTEETKAKISKTLSKDKSHIYSSESNNCKNCGKLIIKRNNVFCNSKCCAEYITKTKISDWLQCPEHFSKENMPDFIRRYLIDKYQGCQICGWNEINSYTGKSPLQVHHIDGNCLNNDINNLQLLCPNCHSLTNTFGTLNNGNSKRYSYKQYRKLYNQPLQLETF